VGGGVGVESGTDVLEEEEEVVRFGRVGGVLPVDVEAVEAEVSEEADGGGGEHGAGGGARGGRREGGGIGPPADGEERLELAVGLFEEEELLGAAVDVFARLAPGCGRASVGILFVELKRWELKWSTPETWNLQSPG
jgi:hypothetical protein